MKLGFGVLAGGWKYLRKEQFLVGFLLIKCFFYAV